MEKQDIYAITGATTHFAPLVSDEAPDEPPFGAAGTRRISCGRRVPRAAARGYRTLQLLGGDAWWHGRQPRRPSLHHGTADGGPAQAWGLGGSQRQVMQYSLT